MKNPNGAYSVIRKRLREVMEEAGLDMRQYIVVVEEDPEAPVHVQAIVIMGDDDPTAKKPVEDDEFDKIMEAEARAEAEKQAEEARKGLEALADDLKHKDRGIGLDDDDD